LADDLIARAKAHSAKGPPLFVGYSSSVTAVYGALAQAKGGAFAGGVSLGFGPDLMTKAPLCAGFGLQGRADLSARWIALQGAQDQVVSTAASRAFNAQIAMAETIMLAKVGHGFSVERNWMPQFLDATAKFAAGAKLER
jgi:hypothetical protein